MQCISRPESKVADEMNAGAKAASLPRPPRRAFPVECRCRLGNCLFKRVSDTRAQACRRKSVCGVSLMSKFGGPASAATNCSLTDATRVANSVRRILPILSPRSSGNCAHSPTPTAERDRTSTRPSRGGTRAQAQRGFDRGHRSLKDRNFLQPVLPVILIAMRAQGFRR